MSNSSEPDAPCGSQIEEEIRKNLKELRLNYMLKWKPYINDQLAELKKTKLSEAKRIEKKMCGATNFEEKMDDFEDYMLGLARDIQLTEDLNKELKKDKKMEV